MWQNTKTQIVRTQNTTKIKNSKCDKTQNGTKLENSNCDTYTWRPKEEKNSDKSLLVRTTWHLNNVRDVLGAVFCGLAIFCLVLYIYGLQFFLPLINKLKGQNIVIQK